MRLHHELNPKYSCHKMHKQKLQKVGKPGPSTRRREKAVVDVLSSEKELPLEVKNDLDTMWHQYFLRPWLCLLNLRRGLTSGLCLHGCVGQDKDSKFVLENSCTRWKQGWFAGSTIVVSNDDSPPGSNGDCHHGWPQRNMWQV